MYNPITEESFRAKMKEIMEGPFKFESKIKAYTGDGKGNVVPLEESPQFKEAMKQHGQEMWGGSAAKEHIEAHIKQLRDESKDTK